MNLNAIHPGEYLIFRRERPSAPWTLLFRDDSRSTMQTRFSYQKEVLKPGQGVQFVDPKGGLIDEFLVPAIDNPAAVCEAALSANSK